MLKISVKSLRSALAKPSRREELGSAAKEIERDIAGLEDHIEVMLRKHLDGKYYVQLASEVGPDEFDEHDRQENQRWIDEGCLRRES